MKKIIILSLAIAFILPLSSFAIEDLSISNGDPKAVVQAWGFNAYQTPQIKAGDTGCPIWYKMGCFDLRGTQYYKNQMLETARQIIKNGFSGQFKEFIEWEKLVK